MTKCDKCQRTLKSSNINKYGEYTSCKNCWEDIKTWAQIIKLD